MKKEIVNIENKKIKDIEINDSIFCIKTFPDIIHQYIRYQNAKARQGTHKTKTRSEVSGRAKKPFSQKGTGNARQGSSKPPHFRGGATSMGPVNRDHSFSLNKKEKKLALKSALSSKFSENNISKFQYGIDGCSAPQYAFRMKDLIVSLQNILKSLKNKFEYTLAPMFSVGRKNLAGFGNLNYSWVPRKNIKMISIGITGKTFGNGLGFSSDSTTTGRGAYYVTQPYIDFQIGKPDSRTFYKQELRLQGLTVLEGGDLYSNTTYGGFMRYKFKYAKGIHEFGAMVRTDYFTIAQKVGILESESDLLNAQVELKYKVAYWESKGKHIELRAFVGQNLFYNGAQDGRYGFALTGQNGTQDAMYEHYMMGRNEFNGLWANQRIDNHGGFKSTSNYGTSTSMIVGTNLIWELPYLPFIAYGDFGMFDNNGTMETVYDAGLGIKLGNVFAVYFPLYESDNLKNSYPSDVKYGQKIRFTLNMSGLNPTKIIQSTL